jgi:hypothetical protein
VIDPPVADWEHDEALRELMRIVEGLGTEDFDRDVAPRLARLTERQRQAVAAAIDATVREARRRGDWRAGD